MSPIQLAFETLMIKGWLPIWLQEWGSGFQVSTEVVEFKCGQALEVLK